MPGSILYLQPSHSAEFGQKNGDILRSHEFQWPTDQPEARIESQERRVNGCPRR